MNGAAQEDSASGFSGVLDRAVRITAIIGFSALVFIAFLTMADVALRYLGLMRLPGFNDLGEVAYAIVVASCFPAGLKKGNAITVRLAGRAMGPRFHAWFDAAGAGAMLLLFTLFAWQFTVLTLEFQNAGRTTSTLEWPTAPVWWLVSILMAACVLVQGWVTLEALAAARKGEPRPAHDDSILE